ncbi:HD domain-containing protein, partial [Geminocystis sp. GBBB08]|uniref:HD domain-containing protein n=1 Tax=Geminocystis sp. GBBB08 TaxID=2604140 RepID=UPI0027E39608
MKSEINCAQTNLQLFNQLYFLNYSEDNCQRVAQAYELATSLFTAQFRSSGKTFISHLVGTASILANLSVSVDLVIAGLLHA